MKFKTKAKGCQLLVRAKTSFKDRIDEKELDRFARLRLRGFLKPTKKKKNRIEYTGPTGISFSERFKKPVTKRDFLFILEQVTVAIQKLQANNFGLKGLVMNLDNVYINEMTKEVQFIYVPAVSEIQTVKPTEFFEQIAYSVRVAEGKDDEFVSRFIYFFHTMNPFDINQIEGFVAKEDRSVVNTIKRQNTGRSGYITNKQKNYYAYYEEKENSGDSTGLLTEGVSSDFLSDDSDEATGLLADNRDEEATGLLDENKNPVRYPVLFRVLTEEEIVVNKPVFRLGKEKSYVDYFVTNNAAVSRSHADILIRGSRCYVKDLNSKNHTYINNEAIPVQTEWELHDGDRLRLGNEEFVFHG